MVSGRGSNLQALIDQSYRANCPYQIKLVFSNDPKAYALERAEQAGIQTQFLDSKKFKNRDEFDVQVLKILATASVQLIVLAGYMRLLSKKFIQAYKEKIINIHPSLLPAFKGLHAQKQAFEYGVKVAGCTVHFVDEGLDSGPIIFQESVLVKAKDSCDDLSQKILQKEHQILVKAVNLLAKRKVKIQNRQVILSSF